MNSFIKRYKGYEIEQSPNGTYEVLEQTDSGYLEHNSYMKSVIEYQEFIDEFLI